MEWLETRLAPATFGGGVSLAAGNVLGDGLTDVVTGAGAGFGPDVDVFNGANGTLANSFFAYDAGFRGGVSVAVGAVFGDGVPDIITGAGPGGGPNVRVFRASDGALLDSFMAYDPRFTGGVNVAVGDVFGDGNLEIITGAGPGGGPNVRVFRASDNALLTSFMAYDPGFHSGVTVAAADLEGTGKADIITGPGSGGGPNVRIFRGADGTLLNSFMAYNTGFKGGVNVAAGLGSQGPELVTGAGPGGGPHVEVFDGAAATLTNSFMAYAPSFHNGVNVADMGTTSAGATAVLAGAQVGPSPAVTVITGANQAISTFSPYGNPVQLPTGGFNVSSNVNPPILQITSPASGQTFSQNVTIQGNVTPGKSSGVASVQAQVDGGAFVSVPFDASGNFSFTTGLAVDGTANGAHTVNFKAISKGGAQSALTSVSFTLNVVVPTVQITSPASGQTVTQNVTIMGTASAPQSTLASVQAQVDGGAFTNVTFDASGKFSFTTSLALDGSADGSHTVGFKATNAAGASSTVATFTFTLRTKAPTVALAIANVSVTSGAAPTVIDLNNHFANPDVVNTMVHFTTNAGGFDVQLTDPKTPLTVQNFLTYVRSGAYLNTIFHRSVPSFIIQAGGFAFQSTPTPTVTAIPQNAAVKNEPGISNTVGTIAMAKLGSDPNSATNQFFFNLADNSSNLDNQNGGFTVFGNVVGSGMSVVNALAAIPTQDRSSFNGAFTNLPLQNYPQPPAGNFPTDTTAANYALINNVSITNLGLTYSIVGNTNPGLVTPSVASNNLTLTYAAGQKGTATLTVQAANAEGLTVTTTFTVTVS